MNIVSRKIDKLGRIVLPMDFRKALGLEAESEVILDIKENAITVTANLPTCKICGSQKDVTAHIRVCSECIKMIKSI